MSNKRIEDAINNTLKGDAQKSALDLITHIRASEGSGTFTIDIHDENDESGWNVSDLGFIIITGSDDFPGPWTMWLNADNIGEHGESSINEHIKEFAWAHISPCGSCGGQCSPGTRTVVFGKTFENVCQHNLIFVNPDAKAVAFMKQIVDIRKRDVLKSK